MDLKPFDESKRTSKEDVDAARAQIAELTANAESGIELTESDISEGFKFAHILLDRANTLLNDISISLLDAARKDPSATIKKGQEESFITDYKQLGILTEEDEAFFRKHFNL